MKWFLISRTLLYSFSLRNPSKDHQRFVDSNISISALDWLEGPSNFENSEVTKSHPEGDDDIEFSVG